MATEEQLSRTIALFCTDFGIGDTKPVLRALMHPRITIVASERVIRSLAGQAAVSTAAMLMARSGHQVFVDTPDAILVGHQPPLAGGSFHRALLDVGGKLIAGVPVTIGPPIGGSDIVFCLGTDLQWMPGAAARYISVGASDWGARCSDMPRRQQWSATDWPFGGLVAAVLMAAEAIKISARILAPLSADPGAIRGQFLEMPGLALDLAPRDTSLAYDVGELDIISAGAVSNGFLYSLLRVPGLTGVARAFDNDISDGPNLNRNALLTTDWLDVPKVNLFESSMTTSFKIEPISKHYPLEGSIELRERVIVGVDDVPARWALAKLGCQWMGVGATSHFNSMASVHFRHSACAACLHPHDEDMAGPTPTVAFASFLAGLMVAADFLRDVSGASASLTSRQRYISALRPDEPWDAPVHPIADCPAQCPASVVKAA